LSVLLARVDNMSRGLSLLRCSRLVSCRIWQPLTSRGSPISTVGTWNAFFLPKGAPLEVVKKLNDATSQALNTSVIRSRLHELGVTGVERERRSPEYLAKFVVDEIARWAGPIKANGLQVD
jgi:tripartite-type tricarboxylate transporter receptor subunit TctC